MVTVQKPKNYVEYFQFLLWVLQGWVIYQIIRKKYPLLAFQECVFFFFFFFLFSEKNAQDLSILGKEGVQTFTGHIRRMFKIR